MFISFVWGVFGKGGFCPGGFCPDTFQEILETLKVKLETRELSIRVFKINENFVPGENRKPLS